MSVMNLWTEEQVYERLLQGQTPEAQTFQRWYFHELLPTLRKTGCYGRLPEPIADILRRHGLDVRGSSEGATR